MWLANQVQYDDGVEYRRSECATQSQCVNNTLIQRGVMRVADSDGISNDDNCKRSKYDELLRSWLYSMNSDIFLTTNQLLGTLFKCKCVILNPSTSSATDAIYSYDVFCRWVHLSNVLVIIVLKDLIIYQSSITFASTKERNLSVLCHWYFTFWCEPSHRHN